MAAPWPTEIHSTVLERYKPYYITQTLYKGLVANYDFKNSFSCNLITIHTVKYSFQEYILPWVLEIDSAQVVENG